MSESPDNPAIRSRFRSLLRGTNIASLIAAIATITAVGTAIGLTTPLLSLILLDKGHSASVIGALSAIAGIAAILTIPFITAIARRLGVVNFLIMAIIIAALCLMGFYASSSIFVWFALQFVMHGCLSVLFVLSEFWINSATPDENRGLVLGIYATVLSLGFAIGPAILAIVGIDGIAPFAIGATIIVAAIGPAWFARNHQPVMAKAGKTPPIFPFLFLVPMATAAAFIFGMAEQSIFALLPVFSTSYGYSESTTALLLTCLALGNLAFQIPLGILSDRVTDRRTVLLGCAIVGTAGAAILPVLATNGWLLGGGIFLWGGMIAGMYTVGLAHLSSRLTGTDLAQANAAFIMAYALGMMIGPQLTGISMDLFGASTMGGTLFILFAAYILLHFARARKR